MIVYQPLSSAMTWYVTILVNKPTYKKACSRCTSLLPEDMYELFEQKWTNSIFYILQLAKGKCSTSSGFEFWLKEWRYERMNKRSNDWTHERMSERINGLIDGLMLCYALLCSAVLCYAMPCYAMLCYAMLCYAMLCCAVLCCAVLWFCTLRFANLPRVPPLEIWKMEDA